MLLRWEVVAWIVACLLAVGGIVLIFDQYGLANACFVITALFCFAKVVHMAVVAREAWWQRMLFTFLMFGILGVGIVETVRGVNRFAQSKRPAVEIVPTPQQPPQTMPAPPAETQRVQHATLPKVSRHESAPNAAHPVIAMKNTKVEWKENPSANRLEFTIICVLYNTTQYETNATVSITELLDGLELAPTIPPRTIGFAPNSDISVTLTPYLGSVSAEKFKAGQTQLIVRITATYPDRDRRTLYTFEGAASKDSNNTELNVLRTDWSPVE